MRARPSVTVERRLRSRSLGSRCHWPRWEVLAGCRYQHHVEWLGAWSGGGRIGLTLSALSWREKNQANGHALDAMNHYNDAVGSLGSNCQDLRYPPAAGPNPADLSPQANSDGPGPEACPHHRRSSRRAVPTDQARDKWGLACARQSGSEVLDVHGCALPCPFQRRNILLTNHAKLR
jgi:hypothetical protein